MSDSVPIPEAAIVGPGPVSRMAELTAEDHEVFDELERRCTCSADGQCDSCWGFVFGCVLLAGEQASGH